MTHSWSRLKWVRRQAATIDGRVTNQNARSSQSKSFIIHCFLNSIVALSCRSRRHQIAVYGTALVARNTYKTSITSLEGKRLNVNITFKEITFIIRYATFHIDLPLVSSIKRRRRQEAARQNTHVYVIGA